MNYQPTWSLDDVMLTASDDEVKRDLEVTCLICGAHLCDAQSEDSLTVLVAVAEDHMAEAHPNFTKVG
jgi:hypothetical protein